MTFEVEHRAAGSAARAGRFTTDHGTVETPVFMPVGTAASVKGVFHRDLAEAGARIILANTYHLYLRPERRSSCSSSVRTAMPSAASPSENPPR